MGMNDSPQSAPEDLESVWEAAHAVGIDVTTLYGWIRRGRVAMYPGLHYRLVSRAAVQALVALPDPGAPADAVAIHEALRHTDVSRRHIVAWVTQGWLASWQGRFGRLVLVEDVQALAQQNAVSAPATGDSTPLPPHPEREL